MSQQSVFLSPRSGSESLGGFSWLPRMIDKARLEAAGEIEALDLEFPCPMDQQLLGKMGIDARTFQTIVVESYESAGGEQAAADAQIIEQLKRIGVSVK